MKHLYFFLVVTLINVLRMGTGVYLEIPNFVLILLFIYAVGMGRVAGGIMALSVGLVEDAMIGRAVGIYAASYLIVVYLAAYLASYKAISKNLVNLFVLFLVGSVLYELLFWFFTELIFEPGGSFVTIFDLQLLIMVVIQSVIGIILYPWISRLLAKGGYLFKY